MKHKNKKLIIPLPTFIFFLLIVFFCCDSFTLFTLSFALLHELGHLLCIRLLGLEVEKITVFPFGADIRLAPSLRSYKAELSVSLAGPVTNLLLALVFLRIVFKPYLALINLVLAVMNLLPITGLDGGRVLYFFLVMKAEEVTVERILSFTSFLCLFFLWVFSTFILMKGNGDPSLFVISCLLFASVFLCRKVNSNGGEQKNKDR